MRKLAQGICLSLGLAALASTLPACQKKGARSGAQLSTSQSSSAKQPFAESAAITTPGKPPAITRNPLEGAKLFVDPESLAMLQYRRLEKQDAAKAASIKKIAFEAQGLWMGEWNTNIFRTVEHFVGRAKKEGSAPVIIAYNIPLRDCGQYSKGGLKTLEQYQRWIRNVAAAIGTDPAVVILEPDALGHFQECLSEQQKQDRMTAISDAVLVLRQSPHTAVYLDAGHARWVKADEMASRLTRAGIEHAHGFSLNVSNYVSTEENLAYGKAVSALTGGKHFVIDTSRNGAGSYEQAKTAEESWCNPPGRKLGHAPTTQTADPLCDGYLWLKRPGESDGECRGGPKAGVWWEEQALSLAE